MPTNAAAVKLDLSQMYDELERMLLKYALRALRLKCLRVEPVPPSEPKSPSEE